MNWLLNTLLALAFAGAIGGCLLLIAATPIVYESWSSRECVKVEDPSGEYSCEKLPPRYQHVWTY